MSFSLYKTSCLCIHPPGISPLPYLCQLVPAAGPAKAAQSVSGQKEQDPEGDLQGCSEQIPLHSSKKKVMCLRKAKYHRDLQWAESCVLLLEVTGSQRRLCGGKCIPGTHQRCCSVCHGAPCTPQPSQTPLPASHSLPRAAGGCYGK